MGDAAEIAAFTRMAELIGALRAEATAFARAKAEACTRAADGESVASAADALMQEASRWSASATRVSAPLPRRRRDDGV